MVEDDNESFVKPKEKLHTTKVFRTVFSSSEGLNPLNSEKTVNFDIDLEEVLRKSCNKEESIKNESIDPEVLNDYFAVTEEDILNFGNDLFLPITDYNYFLMLKNEESEKKLKKLNNLNSS